LKILESNDLGDKMWAVRRVRPFISAHTLLKEKVISLIDNNQYNLSEQIIRELPTTDSTIQRGLAMAFLKNSYAIKKLIVEKLKITPSLTPQVVALFTSALPSLQGESVVSVLELLRVQKINDSVTGRAITDLLHSDNNFVARKAYDFLTKQKINDPYIEEQLMRFQSKQK
jgi:hypothetical protein